MYYTFYLRQSSADLLRESKLGTCFNVSECLPFENWINCRVINSEGNPQGDAYIWQDYLLSYFILDVECLCKPFTALFNISYVLLFCELKFLLMMMFLIL